MFLVFVMCICMHVNECVQQACVRYETRAAYIHIHTNTQTHKREYSPMLTCLDVNSTHASRETCPRTSTIPAVSRACTAAHRSDPHLHLHPASIVGRAQLLREPQRVLHQEAARGSASVCGQPRRSGLHCHPQAHDRWQVRRSDTLSLSHIACSF
jgi:hypothetical protein